MLLEVSVSAVSLEHFPLGAGGGGGSEGGRKGWGAEEEGRGWGNF